MSTFLIFIAGLLIGWLIEWAVDWLYWRRVYADLQGKLQASQASAMQGRDDSAEVDQLRRELHQAQDQANRYETELTRSNTAQDHTAPALAEVEQCRQQLAEAQTRINQYQTQLSEADTCREKLAAAEAEIDRLKAELPQRPGQAGQVVERVIVKDNLERINGIGPVFARRLNEADIVTFDQLAALPPERIQEIIAPQPWQKIDPDAWIAEAREFAKSAGSGGGEIS